MWRSVIYAKDQLYRHLTAYSDGTGECNCVNMIRFPGAVPFPIFCDDLPISCLRQLLFRFPAKNHAFLQAVQNPGDGKSYTTNPACINRVCC
jgi:hypothetical protein